jgi:hypothetical protein
MLPKIGCSCTISLSSPPRNRHPAGCIAARQPVQYPAATRPAPRPARHPAINCQTELPDGYEEEHRGITKSLFRYQLEPRHGRSMMQGDNGIPGTRTD